MEVISWAKPPSDEDARAARQADAWPDACLAISAGDSQQKMAARSARKSREIPTQSPKNPDPEHTKFSALRSGK